MDKKIIIVGTGFSGMLAHLILKNSAIIYGVVNSSKKKSSNKSFTYNKLLGVKAYSFTMLKNKLLFSLIHDRLIHGGNGTVWGGFIRLTNIIKNNLDFFKKLDICLIPLSFRKTGSRSFDKSIYQLQFKSGEILNPGKIFSTVEDAFLERFEILPNSRIRLHWCNFNNSYENNARVSECDKLILAVGVIQFVDLLYRSGFIKDNDYIELDEFRYSLEVSLKITPNSNDGCIISVGFFRSLFHFLGIQKYPNFFSYADRYNPVVFKQVFSKKKISRKFLIENGSLIEESFYDQKIFGKSIHYCNLKINGINANRYLSEISVKVIGLGMAFVVQKQEGPISTDIFEDVIRKLTIEE